MNSLKFTSSIATTCLVVLLGVTFPNLGWANSFKNWIHERSEDFNKEIEDLKDDFNAIQNYLDNYPWKGLIQDKAADGPVTLKHLELNGHSRAVIVKPGEKIEAEVECILDSHEVAAFSVYRIVVGMKGEGAQAVIGNELGLTAGPTVEKFTLTAPEKPGIYEIRFRTIDALFKSTAFEAWKDEEGKEPSGKTTIGIVVVK